MWTYNYNNELMHHGIKGMKWGVRRYQNEDGTLTDAGKKRLAKKLKKDYKRNYDSSQPYKVSEAYRDKLKSSIRKVITNDDIKRVRAYHDKYISAIRKADEADDQLYEIATKYAKKAYDDEIKRNPSDYNTPTSKEGLMAYYVYNHGYYDKAKEDRPDLVNVKENEDECYLEYIEQCKSISDKLLGEYGNTALYERRNYRDFTIRDTVGKEVMEIIKDWPK